MAASDIVICATCGVERDARELPAVCPICADERQWVPAEGQRWLTVAQLMAGGVTIELVEREPGLHALVVSNGTGIGQQAKLIVADDGVVMVDVPAAITADAIRKVRALGPMLAIIPTHPHMFGVQSLWSDALGAPVYVAEADADWLGHRPARLRTWSGELGPASGVTASQPGGHFPGSTVVHWTGVDRRGVLLAGDTIMANPDRASVSFLRSYPNRIPLSAAVVLRIARHVGRHDFDRLYSNFDNAIPTDAGAVVQRSARRHADWVSGVHDDLTGGDETPDEAPEPTPHQPAPLPWQRPVPRELPPSDGEEIIDAEIVED